MIAGAAQGKSPYDDQARTRAMERTQVTRVLSSSPPTANTVISPPATRPRAQKAREVPANRPAPPARPARPARPAPEPERVQRERRTGKRIGWALAIICIFVIVIVVVAILASTHSKTVVQYQQVVAHNAQSAINSVEDIISRYTK